MSESNLEQGTPHFSNLLRSLSIELKSKDVEEMRLMLLAFDSVDSVLASLQDEYGVQVYRGVDVVAEYESSRREAGTPLSHNALDYIVRKDGVELQVQVKLVPLKGFYITDQSIEECHRVLRANPKTEEIVLVWATDELNSISLDLHDVERYFSRKPEQVEITENQLRPLKETILAAFARHRRILREPEALRERRKVEFDLAEAFSRVLETKLDDLRDSAERKLRQERIMAIQSISESDRKQIEILFSRSQREDLEFDELKEQIEAICQNVRLDSDT